MNSVSSLRYPLTLRRISVVVVAGMASTVLASAATAQDTANEEAEDLGVIEYRDRAADVNPRTVPGAPYNARISGDERLARPIAELPQTMTVLTESQIEDSGYTDLARILDAQPGITVGTGENGNAFGDRYIIRGQEARSDVFVDGLRDPGMTTRESFAVDQIEISKGPNSTFAGRGTAGGAINAITKQASTDYDFFAGSVGFGSDRYVRTTADVNLVASPDLAVRANALYAYSLVPDRGPANRQRLGLAVSALYSPGENFDLTLDYYGLRADDNPDIGDYLAGDGITTPRLPVTTPVYAQEQDFQDSDVDVFTARLEYAFSDQMRITNSARYGMSDNSYLVTGARGATTNAGDPNGVYPTITFSTHQGWQEVEYFANQLNFYLDTEMLGGENDLIIGAEYTDHSVLNGIFGNVNTGAFNCRTGTAAGTALNNYCGIGPAGGAVNGINTLLGRQITRDRWDQDWHMETISAYVLDTMDLTDALTVFAGLRLDHFDFDIGLQAAPAGSPAGSPLTTTNYAYSDSFVNGQFGVTYALGELGMIYGGVASGADVNCGESDVGTNAGYGGCIVTGGDIGGGSPERSVNLELGAKFNLFDDRFLFTAALFQTTKTGVFEAAGGGYVPDGTGNTGKNRVRGFEIGLAGNITDAWSMQGGVTLMESEVLESASNPLNIGKEVSNFAPLQASLQARYQLTDGLAFGGAVKYKDRRYGGQPDRAASFATLADGSFIYSQPVPSYTVADIFAEYRINQNLTARVNVNNLFDEEYHLAVYQSGAFLYKGDARQIVGTLNMKF